MEIQIFTEMIIYFTNKLLYTPKIVIIIKVKLMETQIVISLKKLIYFANKALI